MASKRRLLQSPNRSRGIQRALLFFCDHGQKFGPAHIPRRFNHKSLASALGAFWRGNQTPCRRLKKTFEARPIEERPGISLTGRRYIGVAHGCSYRITSLDSAHELRPTRILDRFERSVIASFQLDANRKVVAALAPAPTGFAGMPRAFFTRDELNQLAAASYEKVRRHAQPCNRLIVAMRVGIERVGKQLDDSRSAIFVRRQADIVDDDELYAHILRARVRIG